MKNVISFLCLSIIFLFVMLTEVDHDVGVLLNSRTKDMANRAVHDASLCLDETALSQGRLEYNQGKAFLTLKETLSKNMGSSFSDYRIEVVDFIDDEDMITYPYVYTNNDLGIYKTLNGPAVIAVFTFEKPSFCSLTQPITYKKWAVYEYPFPQ